MPMSSPRDSDKPKPTEDEPTYSGIPKSKYVRALKDKDRAITDQAVKALVAMGKPAEEDLYAAFVSDNQPGASSVMMHWYLQGKKGIPLFTRAMRDKNPRASARAADFLVFLHEQHACLPKGSELRKEAEAALRAQTNSEDERLGMICHLALERLAKLP